MCHKKEFGIATVTILYIESDPNRISIDVQRGGSEGESRIEGYM